MSSEANGGGAAGGAGRRQTYSKDYWDIVLGELSKRRSVRLATVLLVLLYAVAIYAPFLANDLPLRFVGTDYSEYRGAHRLVTVAAGDLVRKAEQGEAGFDEWEAREEERGAQLEDSAKEHWLESRAGAPTSFEAWLQLDRGSLDIRLETMQRQLAPEHHALLDTARDAADAVVDAAVAGDAERVATAGQRLTDAAGEVKGTLRAAKYGEEPEDGRTVALQPFESWPVLGTLTWGDVYFMVLWALVILLPVWNRVWNGLVLGGDRPRIRKARRPKVALLVVLPAIAALAWLAVAGDDQAKLETTSLKEALTEGKAEAVEVVFPPIVFGMAEQNQSETFRPPTWSDGAGIDDEGYYLEGARSQRVDEATGVAQSATPVRVRYGEPERNDTGRHLLGTDSLGRDLMARAVWGARISLAVGLISTVLLVFIGTVVGALAGYFGGWVDIVISRIIEVFQCFPVFFLILIVVAFRGPSILNIMVAIGIFRWTGVARLVRAEFIRLRSQDFVVASQALGMTSVRTIFRHVLPNAMGPVLVAATFAVASGILTESALSFLGFGVQLPVPSWGSLLVESRNPEYWWIQVFPGLLVFVTVILYNLVGEGVRDALDPRLKEA